ncbi:MAG: TRAP-type C4-dicarboxylate transport system permease large subunit [Paracoccaceae bacterium]|jgi:TRAP-type C4-dicarboxylate transport system permease large subunit
MGPKAVAASGIDPLGLIVVVMGLILVLGMFLDCIVIIVITTPILLPAMLSLRIDPIWTGCC